MSALATPRVYVPLLILALFLVAPRWMTPFYLNMAILFLLFAVWGHAWNIIGGYANSLSLGHSAFVAMGAYAPVLLLRNYEITPIIGVWLGVLLSMGLAVLVGWATFRLRGAYFAIATLAMISLLHYLVLHFRGLTGGAQGITVPFRGHDPLYLQFDSNVYYYYILLVLAVLVTWIMQVFERSRLGYHVRATGQDETAAQAIGIDTRAAKMQAFLLSAAITAFGGTIYAMFVYHIDPFYVVHVQFSILIVLPAVVGGLGTVWGPVIGAAILVPVEQLAQRELGGTYAGAQLILYGLVVILILRYRPEGAIHWLARPYTRFLRALPGGRD